MGSDIQKRSPVSIIFILWSGTWKFTVYLMIVVMTDEIVAAMITLQSCKILSVRITNR